MWWVSFLASASSEPNRGAQLALMSVALISVLVLLVGMVVWVASLSGWKRVAAIAGSFGTAAVTTVTALFWVLLWGQNTRGWRFPT